MLSVVCNRDLPEELFDIQNGVIIHVADSVEDAIKYSSVDMMILVDAGWRTRRYLRSVAFEAMVANNPSISFLVVTNKPSLYNFMNDLTFDYRNLDTVELRALKHTQITDKPRPMPIPVSALERFNNYCTQLICDKPKAGVA